MSYRKLSNGYDKENRTLDFKHNNVCRDKTPGYVTEVLVRCNMYCLSTYDAEVTITADDLNKLYPVIDNNRLHMDENGRVYEDFSYYGDIETNCILHIRPVDDEDAVVTLKGSKMYRVVEIYLPHGSDKLELVTELKENFNITKRDQV